MENKEPLKEEKDLSYYKANAEEDYLKVPISVLRYISELEREQNKNKYSEEEVMDMFHNFSMHLPLHYEFLVREQFKKK
jgi:hypothetical protein